MSFDESPLLGEVQRNLQEMFGEKSEGMQVEGNYYFDAGKCGIGYHGDAERKRVIALRLGATMPIRYQWYQHSERIGEPTTIQIYHGDMYVMSEKATGFDWKKRNILTLRHAAGCEKYIA